MLNYAGRIAPAGLVSIVRASDIMWAYCFEILIFVQQPNFWTWIGVVLVLGSLVAIGVNKIKDNNSNQSISPLKKRNSDIVTGNDETEEIDDNVVGKSWIKEQGSNIRMSLRNDEESQELLVDSTCQGKDE